MHLPSSAQRRAVPCGAVSCRAARCCFMLRCAFFRTYSSIRYMMRRSSAAQRRAVPYGAVPCPSVLCRAALCFISNTQQYQASCGNRYRPVCMYRCTRLIFAFLFDCPLSFLFFFRKFHPYWRSEREIANKHTQHSTGTSALRIKQLLAWSNR